MRRRPATRSPCHVGSPAPRHIQRGAPRAATVLLRAAQDGGAPSLTYLLASVSGPQRRALRWALRDAGDRPLSATRCRAAAAAAAALKALS